MAKKERAEQILRAADELFGEVGFAAVSVRDVAQRAGVNKALVFYYFGSKEALFEQVLERYYAAHAEAFEGAFSAEGTLQERMHGVLDAYLDFVDEHQRYPRLVQGVIVGDSEHHALVGRNLQLLYGYVERALGEVAPTEGPLAAKQFFVTLSGAVINYFTYAPVMGALWDDDPLAPGRLAERRAHLHWVVDALLSGLERRGRPREAGL